LKQKQKKQGSLPGSARNTGQQKQARTNTQKKKKKKKKKAARTHLRDSRVEGKRKKKKHRKKKRKKKKTRHFSSSPDSEAGRKTQNQKKKTKHDLASPTQQIIQLVKHKEEQKKTKTKTKHKLRLLRERKIKKKGRKRVPCLLPPEKKQKKGALSHHVMKLVLRTGQKGEGSLGKGTSVRCPAPRAAISQQKKEKECRSWRGTITEEMWGKGGREGGKKEPIVGKALEGKREKKKPVTSGGRRDERRKKKMTRSVVGLVRKKSFSAAYLDPLRLGGKNKKKEGAGHTLLRREKEKEKRGKGSARGLVTRRGTIGLGCGSEMVGRTRGRRGAGS